MPAEAVPAVAVPAAAVLRFLQCHYQLHPPKHRHRDQRYLCPTKPMWRIPPLTTIGARQQYLCRVRGLSN